MPGGLTRIPVIPFRSAAGKIRWMIVMNDVIHFFASREEAVQYAVDSGMTEQEAERTPKSFTFIASSIKDNKKLLEANPEYMANLSAY